MCACAPIDILLFYCRSPSLSFPRTPIGTERENARSLGLAAQQRWRQRRYARCAISASFSAQLDREVWPRAIESRLLQPARAYKTRAQRRRRSLRRTCARLIIPRHSLSFSLDPPIGTLQTCFSFVDLYSLVLSIRRLF